MKAASPERMAARASGLRYVLDDVPGYSREKNGDAFRFRDEHGRLIRSRAILARIRQLAIPPAWTEVWICPLENGHLQATGRDAKHRKQYRYHAAWAEVRGDGKFERIVEFGQRLPHLRAVIRRALAQKGFPRDKVLAMVVAVLADTLIRVGNESYAKDNKSFGLTTLRNRHVAFVKNSRARFQFKGKSGQAHDIVLDDARLVGEIRKCQQLPGQSLFQYLDDDGNSVPVDSGEVNDWLRGVMGEDFTAKDFRTWAGTSLAFRRFAQTPLPESRQGQAPSARALAEVEKSVVGEVADALGNTVSVCRKSYIDPAVFQAWREGRLQNVAAKAKGARQWEQHTLAFLKRSHKTRVKA